MSRRILPRVFAHVDGLIAAIGSGEPPEDRDQMLVLAGLAVGASLEPHVARRIVDEMLEATPGEREPADLKAIAWDLSRAASDA